MNNLKSFKFLIAIIVLVFSVAFTVPALAGPPMMVCGDGMVEGGEECDDGNLVDGDGCSANCTIEPGASCNETFTMCGFSCDITVVKSADPAFNTEFDFARFTLSIFQDPVFDQFSLADSASPETTFTVPFLSATFLAELEPPPGWQLDDIECGPGNILMEQGFDPGDVPSELTGIDLGNIVLAICIFGGEGTCTFSNSAIEGERCNIEVTEIVEGAVVDTQFPFNITAGNPEMGGLDTSSKR